MNARERMDLFLNDNTYNEFTRVTIVDLMKKIVNLGYSIEDISKFSRKEFEDMLVKIKPNSLRSVSIYSSFICSYIKWCYDKNFISDKSVCDMIVNLNKRRIWETKIRIHLDERLISYNEFTEIVNDIEKYEECNSLYYATLFRCIYEGVFSSDFDNLMNLRAADIENGIVKLTDKTTNESYTLEISEELSDMLIECANINKWERNHRYGIVEIPTSGKHQDSCFKIETRRNCNDYDRSFHLFCTNKLRHISKNYIGRKMSASQIYISGIMHRICKNLKNENIDIDEAFSEYNRNPKVKKIIDEELKRCHYHVTSGFFRAYINGFTEIFV